MGEQKGFVSTLEAVLASTIFLIFIINVLPAFTEAPDQSDNRVTKAGYVFETLDKSGELREQVIERNLSGIHSKFDDYLSSQIAIGLNYLERFEGAYSGGGLSEQFDINSTGLRRANLNLWVEQDSGLTVSINGEELSGIEEGKNTFDIFELVQDGDNSIEISGDGELEYVVETYNYMIDRELPDEGVKGVGYSIAGDDRGMNISEVSVYIW